MLIRRKRGSKNSASALARYARHLQVFLAVVVLSLLTRTAFGQATATQATVLPTAIQPDPSGVVDPALSKTAHDLDVILSEAVQDLGLTLDVSERRSEDRQAPSDEAMLERAAKGWVISPRLEADDGSLLIRLVAVPPTSSVILTRTEKVSPRDLEVRASVMLRDVIQVARAAPKGPQTQTPEEPAQHVGSGPMSSGRAVLALNAAVFGGYVGFSLQRASGGSDARLTYPLVALGAGLGLGASMLVADEWNIKLADAWYLSAGTWWPTASGLLLADSYDVKGEDQYVYGLAAAASGVTLSVAALSLRPMTEGGAVLAHSGGVFGLLLGGLTELAYEGSTDETPQRGAGFGAGIGVIAAGALATQVKVSSSRMLFIDLSASLGMLVGAAAASPLLLVEEEQTKPRTRLWLASITAGMVVGGGLGWWWTRDKRTDHASTKRDFTYLPYANIRPRDAREPGSASTYDFGLQGTW